jgi:hypothetical protein
MVGGSAFMRLPGLVAKDALAYCPTLETARKGFALIGPKAGRALR